MPSREAFSIIPVLIIVAAFVAIAATSMQASLPDGVQSSLRRKGRTFDSWLGFVVLILIVLSPFGLMMLFSHWITVSDADRDGHASTFFWHRWPLLLVICIVFIFAIIHAVSGSFHEVVDDLEHQPENSHRSRRGADSADQNDATQLLTCFRHRSSPMEWKRAVDQLFDDAERRAEKHTRLRR